MSVTVRVPAKINLHLGVGAPREDGFHPLMTVFHAIDLVDEVTVSDAGEWSVTLTGHGVDVSDVPADDTNLAVRAGVLLTAHHEIGRSARIEIRKGIPVAGGMAGGSADAAATLVALDRLWGLASGDAALFGIAGDLGSDVPFGLVGRNALGTGRGEQVEQLPGVEVTRWWVVVPDPGQGLSTPSVYRRHDELRPDAPATPPAPHRLVAFLGDPAETLAPLLHNDLQAAALDLRPGLADLLAAGEAAGALRGLVSGSGPTCVFLCADEAGAHRVADDLRSRQPLALVASGPVPGALGR
ncbi:4-(cytidine 5'-diphospho)-2-C-methyl-D-erythritol kinase [Nocardioides sp. GXQ0305]|uniref:4-(cytidine 5'-diphospho)-2-C-methyl-D-erythritol kinase n=1 Tax=Nocardioides sp. GXQ0305 TaxID=3423912 RepID=UPI003D7DA513